MGGYYDSPPHMFRVPCSDSKLFLFLLPQGLEPILYICVSTQKKERLSYQAFFAIILGEGGLCLQTLAAAAITEVRASVIRPTLIISHDSITGKGFQERTPPNLTGGFFMADRKQADKRYDAKRKGKRTRNWVFILYEDSAPPNWREVLDADCVPWIESPWHDQDVNEDAEHTPKKKHKHIMLCYPTVKTFEQVKETTEALNAPIPQAVKSMVGQVRYFAHLDNPEKYQYDRAGVVGHGIDTQGIIDTGADKMQVLMEILAFVRENNIYRFNTLVDYALRNNQTWFRLLANGYTRFISEYLRYAWHEVQDERAAAEKAELERLRFEQALHTKKGV